MSTQNGAVSGMNCRSRRRRVAMCPRGVVFAAVVVLGLAAAGGVQAVTIGIDLGPAPKITSQVSVSFDGLNGTSLLGQSVPVDFSFVNSEFVRLFTATDASFKILVTLQTDASGVAGFLSGTGWLVGSQGEALHPPQDLGSAAGNNGSMDVGLFPLLSGELQRPVDFFGVHLDLTFPTNSLVAVTGGEFQLISAGASTPFGIGPGVPRDIVPDIGSTLLLLGISLTGLVGARI